MVTTVKILNDAGEEILIDVIMRFKIEENNKEYVVYTINDDGKSEDVYVNIAGLKEENGKYQLRLIPEQEKNLVLVFYDNIRDSISGKR